MMRMNWCCIYLKEGQQSTKDLLVVQQKYVDITLVFVARIVLKCIEIQSEYLFFYMKPPVLLSGRYCSSVLEITAVQLPVEYWRNESQFTVPPKVQYAAIASAIS